MQFTGLRTYPRHLGSRKVPDMARAVKAGFERTYHPQSDGNVLFPFKRLFVKAKQA